MTTVVIIVAAVLGIPILLSCLYWLYLYLRFRNRSLPYDS
jgi:hypothetical protein